MSNETHIDKLSIEFTSPEAFGKDIAKMLTSQRYEIQQVLDKEFSKYAPGEQMMVISKLHLHLGTFSTTSFRQEFKKRLHGLLQKELGNFFNSEAVTAYLHEETPAAIDPFHMLHRYLLGGIGESLQKESSFDPDIFILDLFRQDKKRLESVIKTAWQDPNARQRLEQLRTDTFLIVKDFLPQDMHQGPDEKNDVRILELLKFYYSTGEFPPFARSLRLDDLEMLVRRVLEKSVSEWTQYLNHHLENKYVVARIAETLSLDILKKTVARIPAFKKELEEWNAWELLVKTSGVSLAAFTTPGKIAFLNFLRLTSIRERAQTLYQFLHLEFVLRGMDVDIKKISEAIAAKQKQAEAATHILTSELMYNVRRIYEEEQTTRKENASELFLLHSLGIGGSHLSELLKKMLEKNSEELATYIRSHWHEKGLRYNLALRIEPELRERITELVWKEHASYSHWSNLKNSLESQTQGRTKVETTDPYLHFFYFEFLHNHEHQVWNADKFAAWMLHEVGELSLIAAISRAGKKSEKIADPDSVNKIFGYDNVYDKLKQILRSGIKSVFSSVVEFHDEDIRLFWNYVLTKQTMVFRVFHENTVTRFFWTEVSDILNDIQLRQLFAILAPVQHDYICNLVDDFQRYIKLNNAITNTLSVAATYHILFQALHESGYSAGRKELADVFVKFIFSEGNELAGNRTSGQSLYRVQEFYSAFPVLAGAVIETTGWEKRFGLVQLPSVPGMQDASKILVQKIPRNERIEKSFDDFNGRAIEAQRIHALLYFLTFAQWPWWYSPTMPPDADELRSAVLQHHLPGFLEQMKLEMDESEIVLLLLQHVSLSDFLRIINLRFPSVSGFIVIVFPLISVVVSNTQTRKLPIAYDLYGWVYTYLLKNQREFSSKAFLQKFIHFAGARTQLETKELTKLLINRTEQLMKNDSRYWVVLEILKVQSDLSGPDEEESIILKPDVQPVATRRLFERDARSHTKEIFAEPFTRHRGATVVFSEALISYVRFGFISMSTVSTFRTKEEFLKIFNELTQQESTMLQSVIRDSLSSRKFLDAFVARADKEVLEAIIKMIAVDRYAEVMAWRNEMETFLILWNGEDDQTFPGIVAIRSLIALLLNERIFSVTLIQYVEETLSHLTQQGHAIRTEEFQEKINIYSSNDIRPVSSFVNALRAAHASAISVERHTVLGDLLKRPEKKEEPVVRFSGKLHIQNAGIVMLAPFLYPYFDRLEMTRDSMFKTDELSHRAVQLLQFLASGNNEMPEHAMVVNKILCGVKLSVPIEGVIELSGTEKEVSESLLRGVLRNWDKIKTESIDALREGFLLRAGYLEETETGWRLEVDRKAMDILVDLIPWSFNMIKLSWMEKSLTTIWQSDKYRDLM